VEGHASISTDILARYAADAAREVPGVEALGEGRRAVRVTADGRPLVVELHLGVAWGAGIPEVARTVQQRVRDYLVRMADVPPPVVNVVVDEIGAAR
jgi:uncharacterized alkaline shock family protein YloU